SLITNAINTTFTQQSGYTLASAGYPAGGGALYCGAEHLIVSAIQTAATTSMAVNTSPSVVNLVSATFKDADQSAPSSNAFDILFQGRLYVTRVVSGM